ncbi:uncharacterized protein DS421_13g408920 [Arachis hypogaea]|nr:uncharacterized protein DS421_13g408920 [Arachis hypogaea]
MHGVLFHPYPATNFIVVPLGHHLYGPRWILFRRAFFFYRPRFPFLRYFPWFCTPVC